MWTKQWKTIRTGTIKVDEKYIYIREDYLGRDVMWSWQECIESGKLKWKWEKKPGNENKSKTDEFILFLCVEALCVPLFINLYIEFVLWYFSICPRLSYFIYEEFMGCTSQT